ncbi:HAD family hydrolase [Candidatus Woesearchaeota archaeon]|nr:HAD family hydrolase [Candidatus Woesearchaeota archaeon]
MSIKAVFLDRDGTINVDKGYLYKKEDLEFLPNAIKGLKKMQDKGYKLIIITNQSGIGRGYYTEEDYNRFMDYFYQKLRNNGITITADYYCMHSPDEECICRKPNTHLVERAIKEHDIDSEESYFIGDKTSDIALGERMGITTVLVRTGKAGKDRLFDLKPDFVSNDLCQASQIMK